jgi:hypothetical protein
MTTEWKQVPVFTKYEVSSTGLVRRKTLDIELSSVGGEKVYKYKGVTQHPVGTSHMKVTLCQESVSQTFYVSRLVAELFIPNPHSYKFVRNKDGDQFNNDVCNLEWYSKQSPKEKLQNKKTKNLRQLDLLKQELHEILSLPNEP